MGNPILAGSLAPIPQNFKIRWSPTSGGELSANYLGLDLEQMITQAGINAANGVTCDLSFEKNVSSLTLSTTDPASYGYADVFSSIVDKWEIVVDSEKPSLFENPNFLSLFNSLNAAYGVQVDQQFFQLIKNVAENASPAGSDWSNLRTAMETTDLVDNSGKKIMDTGDTTIDLGDIFDGNEAAPLDDPTWGFTGVVDDQTAGQRAFKFFAEEYFRGQTNFSHDKYRLRHTTMAPSTYAANVADFNVEKIYSISQLLSEVQNSSLWILPLPGYLAYKILAYPVPVNMPPNYTWGALKTRSNAITAARGRIEITQEYLIDAISVPTYGLKS